MTRQSQSCEDMRAKCSRQSEQRLQGPKPTMNLECSNKGKEASVVGALEGEDVAREELGRRQEVHCVHPCGLRDKEFGIDSVCDEELLEGLGKAIADSNLCFSKSLWLPCGKRTTRRPVEFRSY